MSLPHAFWDSSALVPLCLTQSATEKAEAEACLQALADRWREVLPSDAVRDQAQALLGLYPLRAADSLQLAAALAWCRNRPTGRTFLCADTRLAEAAAAAGFTILRP